jgi:hypothetical protein
MDEIEQEEIKKKFEERQAVEKVELDEKQIHNDIEKIDRYITEKAEEREEEKK